MSVYRRNTPKGIKRKRRRRGRRKKKGKKKEKRRKRRRRERKRRVAISAVKLRPLVGDYINRK